MSGNAIKEAAESTQDAALRAHVIYLLRGDGAHLDFKGVVADFPLQFINQKLENVPYSAWQVLEHMRIALWDILEFCRNPNHVSPDFPKGYWPQANEIATPQMWHQTIEAVESDLREMEQLVVDQGIDLFARIPHGEGQTILREALLVADHQAYHLGALMLLKRTLTRDAE